MKTKQGKIIGLSILGLIIFGIAYWVSLPNDNSYQNQLIQHDPACVKELASLPLATNEGIPSSNSQIKHFIQDGCGAFYDSNGNQYPINANFTIYPNSKAGLLK